MYGDGLEDAFREAARICQMKVRRDCEYGGRWGGYGPFQGFMDGEELAKVFVACADLVSKGDDWRAALPELLKQVEKDSVP